MLPILVVTAKGAEVREGCAFGEWKSQNTPPSFQIPPLTWLQTPSIVEIKKGI